MKNIQTKRFISLILTILMLVGLFTVSIPVSASTSNGKFVSRFDGEYAESFSGTPIYNREDLENMNDGWGNFYLANDIDLSGSEWIPIKLNAVEFNGNGYVIRNLKITGEKASGGNFGLFSETTGAAIKNLGLEDVIINVTSSNTSIGGIVGIATNTEITNCYVEGNIHVEANTSGSTERIGGIVGAANSTTIKHSYNAKESVVSTTIYTDYIDDNTLQSVYAGGLIGFAEVNTTIQYSFNTGGIFINGVTSNINSIAYAGGFTGSSDTVMIEESYNTGMVSNFATVRYYSFFGGFSGFINNTTIKNSYNIGSISVTNAEYPRAGGFVGGANNSIIETSYNVGIVNGNGRYMGGLVGLSNSNTFVDCYWNSGSLSSGVGGYVTPDPYGVTMLELTQMKDYKSFTGFNFNGATPFWTTQTGVNEGYPILRVFNDITTPQPLKYGYILGVVPPPESLQFSPFMSNMVDAVEYDIVDATGNRQTIQDIQPTRTYGAGEHIVYHEFQYQGSAFNAPHKIVGAVNPTGLPNTLSSFDSNLQSGQFIRNEFGTLIQTGYGIFNKSGIIQHSILTPGEGIVFDTSDNQITLKGNVGIFPLQFKSTSIIVTFDIDKPENFFGVNVYDNSNIQDFYAVMNKIFGASVDSAAIQSAMVITDERDNLDGSIGEVEILYLGLKNMTDINKDTAPQYGYVLEKLTSYNQGDYRIDPYIIYDVKTASIITINDTFDISDSYERQYGSGTHIVYRPVLSTTGYVNIAPLFIVPTLPIINGSLDNITNNLPYWIGANIADGFNIYNYQGIIQSNVPANGIKSYDLITKSMTFSNVGGSDEVVTVTDETQICIFEIGNRANVTRISLSELDTQMFKIFNSTIDKSAIQSAMFLRNTSGNAEVLYLGLKSIDTSTITITPPNTTPVPASVSAERTGAMGVNNSFEVSIDVSGDVKDKYLLVSYQFETNGVTRFNMLCFKLTSATTMTITLPQGTIFSTELGGSTWVAVSNVSSTNIDIDEIMTTLIDELVTEIVLIK